MNEIQGFSKPPIHTRIKQWWGGLDKDERSMVISGSAVAGSFLAIVAAIAGLAITAEDPIMKSEAVGLVLLEHPDAQEFQVDMHDNKRDGEMSFKLANGEECRTAIIQQKEGPFHGKSHHQDVETHLAEVLDSAERIITKDTSGIDCGR